MFPAGSTCESYSFGWTSGCTDDYGITRGYTQEWFFDDNVRAWVSETEDVLLPVGSTGDVVTLTPSGITSVTNLNVDADNNRVNLTGTISTDVFYTQFTTPSATAVLSFVNSSVQELIFYSTTSYSGTTTLRIEDPPPTGNYGEMKIIMKGSPYATEGFLALQGRSADSTGVGEAKAVKLSPDINLAGTTHEKMYKFSVWTSDGGDNYFMSSIGSTLGWDIS